MFYDWKDWMNASMMGLNKVEPLVSKDAMTPPQSIEQVRRDWYKTLKTEELWNLHAELLDEIKKRCE